MTSRKILKRAMLLPLALAVALLSTLLYTRVFAKYFTYDEFQDNATAAHFDIRNDLAEQKAEISFVPGDLIKVTVSNHSEVDVSCTFVLSSTTGNLPLISSESSPFVIEAGDTTEYPLSIEWDSDKIGSEYAGMVDLITVTLTCEQVD